MDLTVETLVAIMPLQKRSPAVAAAWATALADTMVRWQIDTPLRAAHFLAQVAHETLDLTRLRENTNYSAQGLASTWPRRFSSTGEPGGAPNQAAWALDRRPEDIANTVYANRMGNGPPASGDGWRYRGGGPLHCTGRDMYRRAGIALGVDLEALPERAIEPVVGAQLAGWIWAVEKRCNAPADRDDVVAVTERINGGRNGLVFRSERLRTAKTVLGAHG